ncbi:hypothetical protein BHE74_00047210 [Ensete ventricosum]|nr:hypothetical protein BHE74_00047210 [Ensete ventricosum]
MNLSTSNLSTNLSSTPFLDPDPTPPSLNDPDPRGNDEESHTSLEEELEAWGSREAAMRATKDATTRKAVTTPAFFISERSPSSTVMTRSPMSSFLSPSP